jgi:hypothetical protein
MKNNESVKIQDSKQYGAFFSCSDFNIYDALEDFIIENYDFPIYIRQLPTETEIYFNPVQNLETLSSILVNFFENS